MTTGTIVPGSGGWRPCTTAKIQSLRTKAAWAASK
jgi:hypothetical protein